MNSPSHHNMEESHTHYLHERNQILKTANRQKKSMVTSGGILREEGVTNWEYEREFGLLVNKSLRFKFIIDIFL